MIQIGQHGLHSAELGPSVSYFSSYNKFEIFGRVRVRVEESFMRAVSFLPPPFWFASSAAYRVLGNPGRFAGLEFVKLLREVPRRRLREKMQKTASLPPGAGKGARRILSELDWSSSR